MTTLTAEIPGVQLSVTKQQMEESIDASLKITSAEINMNLASWLGMSLVPNWDNAQFYTAIQSGTCRVTLLSTSIGVGNAENENTNTYFSKLKLYLEFRFPGVEFIFSNMSLGGRSLVNYNNDNYQGLASEPSDIQTGYYVEPNPDTWPNGSQVGQSWKDAVQATAPDLLIIAHGMNDRDLPYVYSNYYTAAINDINTWATVPSIAMITEILPADSESFTGLEAIRRLSDFTRWYAYTHNIGLIDVGRAWQAVRNNVDPFRVIAKRQNSIADWEPSGATGTLTDNSFDVNGGTNGTISKRDKNYRGVRMQFEFVPDTNQADFFLQVHVLDDDPDRGCIHVERIGINLRIRKRTSAGEEIAWVTGVPTAGVREFWDIRVQQCFVEIYRDGVLVGKHNFEHSNCCGTINFTLNTAIAENIVVDLIEDVKPFNAPLADDAFLLGGPEQASWHDDDFSLGGNSINHPSRLAVINIIDPVIRAFVSSL